MLHKIKLNEQFCDAIYKGAKTFEIRNNDRNYQISDLVQFIPVSEDGEIEHPVRENTYEITYVLSGWGIPEGYVMFSIKELDFL